MLDKQRQTRHLPDLVSTQERFQFIEEKAHSAR